MYKRIFLVFFIIVFNLSLESLYSQSIKSNLVAYYPFDENADDKSGNNQTGIVYGNPQIVNGKIGSAYYFNGINDRIEIKNRVSDDFTFSMWIKTGTSNSGSNGWEGRQLISNENSFRDPKSIQGRDVYLSVLNNSISLGGCNKNNSDHTMSATTVVTDMNWHFIVATHTGNIATIYIDGKLVIEGKMDLKVGSPILNIGHSISDGQSFNFYKGITKGLNAIISALSNKAILNAKNAYYEGKYLLVLDLLKDFPK